MGHRGDVLDYEIARCNLQLPNSIVTVNHGYQKLCLKKGKGIHKHISKAARVVETCRENVKPTSHPVLTLHQKKTCREKGRPDAEGYHHMTKAKD